MFVRFPTDAGGVLLSPKGMQTARSAFEARTTFAFKKPVRPRLPKIVGKHLLNVAVELFGSAAGIGVCLEDLFKVVGRSDPKALRELGESLRAFLAFGHGAGGFPLRRLAHLRTTAQRGA